MLTKANKNLAILLNQVEANNWGTEGNVWATVFPSSVLLGTNILAPLLTNLMLTDVLAALLSYATQKENCHFSLIFNYYNARQN